MRSIARLALASLLTLTFVSSAEACHRCNRGVRFLRGVEIRQTVIYRSTVATCAPACPTPAGFPLPAPQVPAKVVPAQAMSATMTEARPAADDAATFLALLNDARARAGKPSLAWDATLAAYAATNNAKHMLGSSGGASQCWAQTRSYREAFYQWAGSPAHWSILMSATSAVGISNCPSGTTCNAR